MLNLKKSIATMKKTYKLISFIVLAIALILNNAAAQSPVIYNTAGTYTWVCPVGITKVDVKCWGAGGGGGQRTNTSTGASGGAGGGAYASNNLVSVTAGTTYTITVGGGGSGATGADGGNTSFGALVKAEGGKGGGVNNSTGGFGGSILYSIGAIIYAGGNGANGSGTNGGGGGGGADNASNLLINGSAPTGGIGTLPNGGNGGDGRTGGTQGPGLQGLIYGGGGGGAYRTGGGAKAGGAGAGGYFILNYLTVTSSSPTCAGVGYPVVITGTNFTAPVTVKFGAVTATTVTVNSSTQITAIVPFGATNNITVITPTGSVTRAFTVSPIAATITPNYCGLGGTVGLQAAGSGVGGSFTYLWSNGVTPSLISTQQAGAYSVTVTNGVCKAKTSINVATELATNGDFEAGNTGFTTDYNSSISPFVCCPADYSTGLGPEGKYAVGPNPNFYHDYFFGADHTNGSGNMMIVNGSNSIIVVWKNLSVAVQPNTTYYFSAWAMSVNDAGPFATLQFSVNGLQVGTVAQLTAGPNMVMGSYAPYWKRFYGSWNSGPATTADIRILDLQTAPGGNDFALDDVSFGTLAPISLAAVPDANGNSGICIGNPLYLTANAVGGASPFTFAWSGPGFSSALQNPTVSASAAAINNGTYNLTVTDAHGCTTTVNTVITVNPLPTALALTAPASVCNGTSTNVTINGSQTGMSYQLRNNIGNIDIGIPVQGTGGTILLPTGNLTVATTFNVLATSNLTECSSQMTNTVTVSIATTPFLIVSNQTICTGVVDLTLAAVTAGSTGGGTLTYWYDAAASASQIPTPTAQAINTSGTYYIKSTVASCFDIEPVVVNIGAVPGIASFSYSGSPFCSKGNDPMPVLAGGAFADVFSAPAGFVWVSTSTGQIDVSACAAGTYNVTLTMTPGLPCAVVTKTTSVTITSSPVASFSYLTNGLCQQVNGTNPAPIFSGGATAGTFSSSAGMNINPTNGIIDILNCTPGNYAIINSFAANGGCPVVADTEYVDVYPYTFTGSLSASASTNSICLGQQTINLFSSATPYLSALFKENFNGGSIGWVTGGTGSNANSAWQLRTSPYANPNGGANFNSQDNKFFLSNSEGAGNCNRTLRSPVMSSVGYSNLQLDFFQYFRFANSGDAAFVEVSTSATGPWTIVQTYNSATIGAINNFTNSIVNLNFYTGQPSLYIQFRYSASADFYWAIDKISVTGTSQIYNMSWTSAPVGFTSLLDNPTFVAPTVSTFYVVTATNTYGCSTPNSPVPVQVNPLPTPNAGLDNITCNGNGVNIGSASTAGSTYSWSPTTGLSSAAISNPVASPLIATTYTVTETTLYGCSVSDNVIINIHPSGLWLGTSSSAWNTAANWCGGIPTSTTDVTIPVGAPNWPDITVNNATCNDLYIQTGATLKISTGGDLKLYGDLTIDGTYTHTGGVLEFVGSAAQAIFTNTPSTYYSLLINNNAGVTIDHNILITSLLTLTNGKLTTDANEVQVTSNAAGSVSGYSTASYVFGNLRRNVAAPGIYDFPVGDATNYQLATVNLNSQTGMSNILVFFNSVVTGAAPAYPTTEINGDGINGVLNSGFWTITPNAYTAVSYDVTLTQRGFSNYSGNANQMGVIKRPNSSAIWSGTTLVNSNGHHDNATQSIGGGIAVAKRTLVTSFSDFAIGFGAYPLPVELTSFTATVVDNKQVDLFWNTQAELNCKYFSVQRSADGINFSELGKVNGNGTSQIGHDYTFVDQSPLCSIAYYRLMQVDENGETHYTPIAAATINCFNSFSVYPNPTLGNVMIDLSSINADNSIVKILGLDGKIYMTFNSSSVLLNIDASKLPAGFYFVNISNGNQTLNSSFIRE